MSSSFQKHEGHLRTSPLFFEVIELSAIYITNLFITFFFFKYGRVGFSIHVLRSSSKSTQSDSGNRQGEVRSVILLLTAIFLTFYISLLFDFLCPPLYLPLESDVSPTHTPLVYPLSVSLALLCFPILLVLSHVSCVSYFFPLVSLHWSSFFYHSSPWFSRQRFIPRVRIRA